MSPDFDEDSARAWMREARELARDQCTGQVHADELAERCALAFGVGDEGGPLSDPQHWQRRVAREAAAEVPLSVTAAPEPPVRELVVIRMRNHARTYWMISNGETTRTFAPHVAQGNAIKRFEDELRVKHARVVVHRQHHTPEDAAGLVARTLGRN
jgi:hypothetical protein